MSFAGKVTRGRALGRQGGTLSVPQRQPAERPSVAIAGRDSEIDWQHVAIFATGLAIGVAAGAGAALLLAPRSGRDTRRALARRGRRLRSRTHDAWDDLRDELREAARRSGRSLRGIMHRRARQEHEELDEEMSA